MKRKYLILFSLSGLIIALDQLSKTWAVLFVSPGEEVPLFSNWLSLVRAQNSGFAFGLIQRAPDSLKDVFFIGVPVFALVLIVLIFIKLQDEQLFTSFALTTLLAGAIGNLIDRVQYGHVLDFLQVRFLGMSLPPFNLADCSIMVGVVLMILSTFRKHPLKETA
jgi:signal peptidase II